MSRWEHRHQPYVYTTCEGTNRWLIAFNQSGGGVYVRGGGYHLSLHTNGRCHIRQEESGVDPIPQLPFEIGPLSAIQSRFIGGQWLSLHPAAVSKFGRPLGQVDNTKAMYLDPADFGPGQQPVIEYWVYAASQQEEVDAWSRRSLLQRPRMDHLLFRRYDLEDQGKCLGVFLYRMSHEITPFLKADAAESLAQGRSGPDVICPYR